MSRLSKVSLITSLLLVSTVAPNALGAAPHLKFTLAEPLKKAGCAGDIDGDCLDDAYENVLAWLVAPNYYLHSGEHCVAAFYNTGDPTAHGAGWSHYVAQNFHQVRPSFTMRVAGGFGFPVKFGYEDIATWANDAAIKYLTIGYVFAHPYDCNTSGLADGHLGDAENVQYVVSSTDLSTWTVVDSTYWHHGASHHYGAQYLADIAVGVGTVFTNVAADRNGHGSWPGRNPNTAECAGEEDDCTLFCNSRYCFRSPTFNESFWNGYYTVPFGSNIGEPFGTSWNWSALSWEWNTTTQSWDAFSSVDSGHGRFKEYWTQNPNSGGFCGWKCPDWERTTGQSCHQSVHGTKECSSPLSEKVIRGCVIVNGVRTGC